MDTPTKKSAEETVEEIISFMEGGDPEEGSLLYVKLLNGFVGALMWGTYKSIDEVAAIARSIHRASKYADRMIL